MRLPIVILMKENDEGKMIESEFFADQRLREYRSIHDPHYVIPENDVSGSMEEVIKKYRSIRDGGDIE